jgi:glycosyltransferase involved in cell wall biosynthesis
MATSAGIALPELTIAGETFNTLAGGALKPPLVSIVVISWNHERFVEAAIGSIRRQTYTEFECVFVDNASSDGTLEAARRAIGDDPRFTIVERTANAGQLGAFLEVFDRLGGEFVLIVDSDDLIFSNDLATHVQVHLALRSPAAVSAGAIVEIGPDDRALHTFRPDPAKGSSKAAFVQHPIRVPCVSDEQYRELTDHVLTVPPQVAGWLWAHGTAIVYRRSAIAAILPVRPPADRLYADGYLAPLCHGLYGSALIDLPLSAWRIHGANESGTGVLGGATWDKPGVLAVIDGLNRERLARALAEPERLGRLVSGHYWYFVDAAVGPAGWHKMRQDDVLAIFTASYPALARAFGMPRALSHMARRIPFGMARRAVSDSMGRPLTPSENLVLVSSAVPRHMRLLADNLATAWSRLRRLFGG